MFILKPYEVVLVPVKYSQIFETSDGRKKAIDTLLPEVVERYWRRETFDRRVLALEATPVQRNLWSAGARSYIPETIESRFIDNGKTFLAMRKLGPDSNHGRNYEHEVVGEYAKHFLVQNE